MTNRFVFWPLFKLTATNWLCIASRNTGFWLEPAEHIEGHLKTASKSHPSVFHRVSSGFIKVLSVFITAILFFFREWQLLGLQAIMSWRPSACRRGHRWTIFTCTWRYHSFLNPIFTFFQWFCSGLEDFDYFTLVLWTVLRIQQVVDSFADSGDLLKEHRCGTSDEFYGFGFVWK